MSKTSKKIARYIESHQQEVLGDSITKLARKIGTSPSSISRFCQDLHYNGYSDMRFCMEKRIHSPFAQAEPISHRDSVPEFKQKFVQLYGDAITETLLQIKDPQIERVAAAISNAGKVYLYGNGGAGVCANLYYLTFLQLGIPCNVFTEQQLALMSVPHLTRGDVAIGLTYSGNATLVIETLEQLRGKGVTLVGVTAHRNSPLARLANIMLCYSYKVEDDLRYLHLARMCELAVLGQIQSALINRMPHRVLDKLQASMLAITQTRTDKK